MGDYVKMDRKEICGLAWSRSRQGQVGCDGEILFSIKCGELFGEPRNYRIFKKNHSYEVIYLFS